MVGETDLQYLYYGTYFVESTPRLLKGKQPLYLAPKGEILVRYSDLESAKTALTSL